MSASETQSDERLRVELPDTGTGARRKRASAVARTRGLLAGAIAALVVVGIALTYVGVATVRDSTEGKRIDPVTDPDEPGFEAFVTPTPTMIVVHAEAGDLVGLAVLALGSGDRGGSVVLVPPGLMGDYGAYGTMPLDVAYADLGVAGVRTGLANVMGMGLAELTEVDAGEWTRLTEGVGTLSFTNPDAVSDGERSFPAGPLQLAPSDVGSFLAATSDDESDLNRLVRAQLLWESWLTALEQAGTDAIPGETDAGLGRFLGVLSGGVTSVESLPVDELVDAEPSTRGWERFTPRPDDIATLVAGHVPLPTGPAAGVRARVRLLNGTTDPDVIRSAAQALVGASAEITILGNAERFGLQRTEIAYYDDAFADEARRFADALGDADVVQHDRAPAATEVIDITVRIGADFSGASEGGSGDASGDGAAQGG
jgi:hypothetical protein